MLLLVATASIERTFSALNIIKTDLHKRMSNEWLNDLILCYIEKEIVTEPPNLYKIKYGCLR